MPIVGASRTAARPIARSIFTGRQTAPLTPLDKQSSFEIKRPTGEADHARWKAHGSGRPEGAISFRMRAVLEAAASGGEMPIAYMLRVMRNENAPDVRRDDMAKAAAPYLYSKLSSIGDEDGEDTEPASEGATAEPARADT